MPEAKKVSRFKKDVRLFLPQEYGLPIGEWERLFSNFQEEGFFGLGVAKLLQLDMEQMWKSFKLDFEESHAEISNIRSTPDGFLVDIEFDTSKTGLAMLFVCESTPDIGFVPVVSMTGNPAIQRVSMTHIPS